MNHWILKTEPSTYSWEDVTRDGVTFWNGIRNYQARNNLKAMKKDDVAFFYHSGEERRLMGLVKIIKEAYPDSTSKDPNWVMVDVKALKPLKKPVDLTTIKLVPELQQIKLVKQGRLSVSPLTQKEFKILLKLSKTKC